MTDYSEILEVEESKNEKTPEMVRVLSIISYIGNGFWILAFLTVVLVARSNPASFDSLLGGRINTELLVTIFSYALIIAIVLGSLCIYGAYKMYKGFKSGFTFYAIGNGLWVLLLVFGSASNGQNSNYLILLISVGFLVGFASQLKHLR